MPGQDLSPVLGQGLIQSGHATYLENSSGPPGVFLTSSPRVEMGLQATIASNLQDAWLGVGVRVGGKNISLQKDHPNIESPWPNINLTDNLKNQNQCQGAFRMPAFLA